MTATFFGHKDAPSEVYPLLERKIVELAEENDELTCYVGTHGAFDRMAQRALKVAVERYPHVRAHIVLAYYEPTQKDEWEQCELPTIYPEGIESVPKRYAIDFRNKFMVKECDMVICYITHSLGGAARYVEMARRKGRTVINIAKDI